MAFLSFDEFLKKKKPGDSIKKIDVPFESKVNESTPSVITPKLAESKTVEPKKSTFLTFDEFLNKKKETPVSKTAQPNKTAFNSVEDIQSFFNIKKQETPQEKPLEGLFSIRNFKQAKEYASNAYEGVSDLSKYDTPIAGSVLEGVDLGSVYMAKNRAEKGEATQADNLLLQQFLSEQEIEEKKYQKAGYGLGSGIKSSLLIGVEIASILGAGSAIARGTAKVTGKVIKKEIAESIKETLKSKLKTAGIVSVGTSYRLPKLTFEKMIGDYSFDENENILIDKPSDSVPLAISKAIVENTIEMGGEMIFGEALNVLGSGAKSQLIRAGWLKAAKELNPNVPTSVVKKLVDKAGWNGMLGEMGEEEMQNLANGLMYEVGLSDQEYKIPTAQDLTERLLTFGVIQTAVKTVDRVVSGKAKEKVDTMTEEQKTQSVNDMIDNSVKTRLDAGQNPADVTIQIVQQTGMTPAEAKEIVNSAIYNSLAETDTKNTREKLDESNNKRLKQDVVVPVLEDVPVLNTVNPQKEDVAEDAKNYKSAEEFVKAQGTPFEKTLYRGSGEGATLGLNEVTAGNALGEGKYYAGISKASRYGKNIEEKVVKLNNPLVIKTDIDLAKIAIKAGNKYGNPLELDPLATKANIERMRKYIIDNGHDGVVVEMGNYMDSQVLRKLFEHDQVIDYGVKLPTKSQLTDIWNEANKETPTKQKPSYQEWLRSNPEAKKEAGELSEKTNTLKGKHRVAFMKNEKSKFDSKYVNKWSKETPTKKEVAKETPTKEEVDKETPTKEEVAKETSTKETIKTKIKIKNKDIELPQEIQERILELEIKKETIAQSPYNIKDARFLFDKEGRVRELGDVKHKNVKLVRIIERMIAEVKYANHYKELLDPTEFVEKVVELQKFKEKTKTLEIELKKDIAEYKQDYINEMQSYEDMAKQVEPEFFYDSIIVKESSSKYRPPKNQEGETNERAIVRRLKESQNEALRVAFEEEAKVEGSSQYDIVTFEEQSKILENILQKPNAGEILVEVLEGNGPLHESGLTIGTAIKAVSNNIYTGALTPELSLAVQYAAKTATTLGQQIAHLNGLFKNNFVEKMKEITHRRKIVYAKRKGYGNKIEKFDEFVNKKVDSMKKDIKENKGRKNMKKDAWADLIKDLSC